MPRVVAARLINKQLKFHAPTAEATQGSWCAYSVWYRVVQFEVFQPNQILRSLNLVIFGIFPDLFYLAATEYLLSLLFQIFPAYELFVF